MLSPFRGFWDMQSEVDRMFNDMVGGLFRRRRAETATRTWSPRLAAYAKDGDLVLHADLCPGFRSRTWTSPSMATCSP